MPGKYILHSGNKCRLEGLCSNPSSMWYVVIHISEAFCFTFQPPATDNAVLDQKWCPVCTCIPDTLQSERLQCFWWSPYWTSSSGRFLTISPFPLKMVKPLGAGYVTDTLQNLPAWWHRRSPYWAHNILCDYNIVSNIFVIIHYNYQFKFKFPTKPVGGYRDLNWNRIP